MSTRTCGERGRDALEDVAGVRAGDADVVDQREVDNVFAVPRVISTAA